MDAERLRPKWMSEMETPGNRKLTLLHTADVHLDNPPHGMADHSQGDVAAWYAGTPTPDWSTAPPGHVLLVECCPERDITVRPQRV